MPKTARLHFVDRRGGKSQLQFYLPDAATITGSGVPAIEAVIAAVLPLVNAHLTRYEILISPTVSPGPAAAPGSSVFRRLSLFYTNGSEFASVLLPSPIALPIDADEPYAAIRLTRDALVLSGMLGSVENLIQGTVRSDGTPFPATFVVGGAAGSEL